MVAVWVRRYGPRGFALGMAAFMPFFFTQFLKVAPAQVPADLVTQSGSGLDPHVSPQAALLQAPRIARARRVDEARVRRVIEQSIEPAQFGVLGAPRVNVLALNLALDAQVPVAP